MSGASLEFPPGGAGGAGVPAAGGRIAAADVLKAVASQLIVLHHLAFYGPMADHAWPLAPALLGALADHGRIAVQAFLVVGGLLAARALAPDGRLRAANPAGALVARYLRLALPLAAVLGLAIAGAAIARALMAHPATPEAPYPLQVVLHLLLLQDVAGVPALSAGLWYVAIDFQLYALLLALLGLASRIDGGTGEPLAPWFVFAGVAASLLFFNRLPATDVAAPYFLGAYGLGALVAWWGRSSRRALWVAALVALALGLEFRARIAVAATVAAGLWALAAAGRLVGTAGRHATGRRATPGAAVVGALARISYAVFLTHYPVSLLINAAFERALPHRPAVQALGVLLAWGASLAAGAAFHRYVERPAAAWIGGRRAPPSALRAV